MEMEYAVWRALGDAPPALCGRFALLGEARACVDQMDPLRGGPILVCILPYEDGTLRKDAVELTASNMPLQQYLGIVHALYEQYPVTSYYVWAI